MKFILLLGGLVRNFLREGFFNFEIRTSEIYVNSFFGVKPFFFNFETSRLRRTTQVEVVVVVLSVVLPAGDSMLLPLQLLLFLFGTKANRPPPCRRCPDPALVSLSLFRGSGPS